MQLIKFSAFFTFPLPSPSSFVTSLMGTLRNYDGEGNENKKKRQFMPSFLYISLPSLQQLRREMTKF